MNYLKQKCYNNPDHFKAIYFRCGSYESVELLLRLNELYSKNKNFTHPTQYTYRGDRGRLQHGALCNSVMCVELPSQMKIKQTDEPFR